MLGVHYAVTANQDRALFAAAGDGGVGEYVEDLEESWSDDKLRVDSDKAWDAIHRCLGDGTLDPDSGDYPLSHAVLGGRHLHEEYYVVYASATETEDVAAALLGVDRGSLRRRFDAINDPDYAGAHDDTDFEYMWTNFLDVRAFFQRAAAAGRAVIFTAM
ncbi:hypothetical protein FB565_008767 [Actinoplanes lutulentus]|uniref:Uncharacterized protein DUF1877 n=1 Tax=Actinoplanes lutulentus TaxID=1287878 RepID=A0A327Z0X4_9ACTN|nr:DUF1877 family protein [Actinoplanes lutulentus]MBB2948981.1 hypothetical protein [Actinoplanes lutulentus]RAK26239.1 uncharacterized protein DUF1877 [Actinoplanes lutulentus]